MLPLVLKSIMNTSSFTVERATSKPICLVRFAYHLWRVDAAARAYPRPHESLMQKRWEIGLVLEIVRWATLRTSFVADRSYIGRPSLGRGRCLYDGIHDHQLESSACEEIGLG